MAKERFDRSKPIIRVGTIGDDMTREIKGKILWSIVWAGLFYMIHMGLEEFVDMYSATLAVAQVDDDIVGNAFALKVVNGFFFKVLSGVLALFLFVIWVSPAKKAFYKLKF